MTEEAGLFAEEPPVPEHINVLLYGATGSGRSAGAATAPGPIMWLNTAGPNALAYPRIVARHRGTEVYEVRFGTAEDPRPKLRAVVEHLRSGEPVVQTVVVDTIGRLRKLLIAAVVTRSKDSREEFVDIAGMLQWFIGQLRDLPVNAVLIAHEAIEDGGRVVGPQIGGVLTEDVVSEVDIIGYCQPVRDDDQLTYCAHLVESRGRRAKDRSGGLGGLRPVDLSEWRDAFRAALGRE